MRENDFLSWIASRSDFDPAKVPVGPGDDMAVVAFDKDWLLTAVDQVLDGVHFDLAKDGPRAAGRKAMARNLSDVAAMAALPVGAVASVALPKGMKESDAREIYFGLRELGDEFACPLVGGDVSIWPGRLAISVTIFAKPAGVTGGIAPVLRSGARPGNAIFVTGALGGAWRTDRHLTFTPRVREAIVLSLRYRLRAMIDISDGLAMDLHRMCRASGVGADIHAAAIPVHPDAAAGRKIEPLEAALFDGEDYELLFTIPSGRAKQLESDDKIPLPVTRIGTITKGSDVVLIRLDGTREPLPQKGWEHQG
ncbi:MAG: thiamine-monophosphate kinase [Phycisphaerae bacterium]|nr:thiamine-monophosphate kinase [Phycisphaerae bacterium]